MTRAKYGNIETVIDGITFDSRAESRRYVELKLLEAAGEIEALELHPVYMLREKHKSVTGRSIPKWTYTADFRYYEVNSQSIVVEDVKGFDRRTGKPILTRGFQLARNQLEYLYPVELRIVEA